MFQHVGELAGGFGGDILNQLEEEATELLVVLGKDFKHLAVGDRRHIVNAAVVIGNQGNIHRLHAELFDQVDFRVLSHVNDFPALIFKPLGFGSGAEPGALDDHHRAGFVNGNATFFGRFNSQLPQIRAEGIRSTDMSGNGPIKEGVFPTVGPVDKLIADDEIARLHIFLQATRSAGADDPLNAQGFKGPDVSSVVDFMRREMVTFAVTGEKRHPLAGDGANGNIITGAAVGGVHFNRLWGRRQSRKIQIHQTRQ